MNKHAPEFLLAGGMSTTARLTWAAVLSVVGVAIQILFSVVFGWFFLLAAVLLTALKGKSNTPQQMRDYKWHNVTIDELKHASRLLAETERIKQGSGCRSVAGCGVALIVIGLLGLIILVGALEIPNMSATRPWRSSRA